MNQTIQTKGFYTLGATALLLSGAACLYKGQAGWLVPSIVALVGIQSMAAFWGLLWALRKSDHAFFSVFVGDALVRMVGLGATAFWLWSRHLPYNGPLLTLAFAYLVMSFVQIPFFYRVR